MVKLRSMIVSDDKAWEGDTLHAAGAWVEPTTSTVLCSQHRPRAKPCYAPEGQTSMPSSIVSPV